jgi:hypothetical protein
VKFKRNLAILVSLFIVVSSIMVYNTTSLAASSGKFSDVPAGYWAGTAIERLAVVGVINGKDPGKFKPEDKVTRAEFAAFLVRALGLELDTYQGSFKDVKNGKWYTPSVEAVASAGIVNGYANGRFYPDAYITREQMAVMVMQAFCYEASKTVDEISEGVSLTFRDKEKISIWAIDYVKAAYDVGIIRGMQDGTFRPEANATRAQSATVIYNMLLIVPIDYSVEAPGDGTGEVPVITEGLKIENVTASTEQAPDYVASNVIDGNKDGQSRWSGEGDGAWIKFDLGAEKKVQSVGIAWYDALNQRTTFDIEVSADGSAWTKVYSGTCSGTTLDFENYNFDDVSARYVRIVGHGNDGKWSTWNSITEVAVYGE